MMRRDKIDHVLRAAAKVTGHRTFVLVGSTVILLRCSKIPGTMLLTPENDIYVPDAENEDELSDLIEASLGQGSDFHNTHGYYADGVSSSTSVMPTDWHARSIQYRSEGCPGVLTIIPEENDVALAKMVAWREKDVDWLTEGVKAKLFSLTEMHSRLDAMPANAPDKDELVRRLSWLASACKVSFEPEVPTARTFR